MITKARDPEVWQRTRYFPIQKHWRELGPIFKNQDAERIWRPCLWEYYVDDRSEGGYEIKRREEEAKSPSWYDGGDWNLCRREPFPDFWEFVCVRACHWVADLALYVAKTSRPKVPWRILHCQKHTTVWNGCTVKPILFDLNWHAVGIPAQEAIKTASKGRELKPHQYFKPYLHHAP